MEGAPLRPSASAPAAEAGLVPAAGNRWLSVGFWVWLAGALISVSPVFLGWLGIRRLARRTKRAAAGREFERLRRLRERMGVRRPVRLLWGPFGAMPMTWGFGVRGPSTILLPAEASHWSDARLDAVLLHELAHVRRRDCLTQLLSRCACAVFWFHPWVWIAAGRLLVERERACDDEVLRFGSSPAAYARDLVDVASGSDSSLPAARAAIAMARPHKLDSRLRALMDTNRSRAVLTRGAVATLVLFSALVLLPVASLQWAAEEEEPDFVTRADPEETEGRTLAFAVVDVRTGEPLPEAGIDIRQPSDLAVSDTDVPGFWRIGLGGEPLPYLLIHVEAEGFVPMLVHWQNGPGEDVIPDDYTIALEPGTWVGGRIVDENGVAVANATVFLDIINDSDRSNERANTRYVPLRTDDDGRWEYSAAPANFDGLSLGVHHPDFASHVLNEGYMRMHPYGAGDGYRDGSLVHTLTRGVPLEGVVLDAEGNPAEGATIGIGRSRVASNMVPERRTDGDGRFRLGVHRGESVLLTIKHSGHAPELVRIPPDEFDVEHRIQLSPGHTLRGRIVDSGGRPVEGARAFVDTWRGVRTLVTRLHADSEGYFRWDEAPEEEIRIDVLAPGFADKRGISVRAGRENRIELARPAAVRGRVVDGGTGEPVTRFTVVAEWIQAGISIRNPLGRREIEDPDGRFEWFITDQRANLEGYVMRIEVPGYRILESSVFNISGDRHDLTLELESRDWPTGRVVDLSGEPAEGATVYIASAGTDLRLLNGEYLYSRVASNVLELSTDGNGHFSFPPRDDPFIIVVLHDRGYREVTWDAWENGDEVVLQPWARIEGRALVRGEVAAGRKISSRYLRDPGQGIPHVNYEVTTTTDDDGRFVLDRLPAKEVLVSRLVRDERTWHSGYRRVYQSPIRVRLEPGSEASVVVGGSGRPVVGRIDLGDADGVTWNTSVATIRGEIPAVRDPGMATIYAATSDFVIESDGSFRLDEVLPGDYRLSARISTGPGSATTQYVHGFTVPEFEGPYTDEPVELPLLSPQ